MRDWFRVDAASKGKGGGEILIYSYIGKRWSGDTEAVDARAFVEALNGLAKAGPGDIHIRINSPGGDVGAGMTIYNAIRSVKKRAYCTVEGYAYSMASIIALGGRETRMSNVGQFMVHNPTVGAWGGVKEMERAIAQLKTARKVLVTAYASKTGKPSADIEALMEETTFMTADEAKEFGFVDVVIDGEEIPEGALAACFDAQAWAEYWQGSGLIPAFRDLPVDGVDEENTAGTAVPHSLDGGAGAPEAGKQGAGKPPLPNGVDAPKETMVMPVKFAEIKAKFPKASLEFVSAQFELCEANESRTIEDVKDAYIEERDKALEAAQAATVAAQAEAEAAKKSPPAPAAGKAGIGVPPLGMGGGGGDGAPDESAGDPVAAWDDGVEALMKRGMPKARAVREMVRTNPEMHAAYIDAYTEEHASKIPGRRRVV